MQAADIMTREVVTVAPGMRIADAIRVLLTRRISGVPVVDTSGVPVGMLTGGDLLRRGELGTEKPAPGWFARLMGEDRAADFVRSHAQRVAEVMTREVISAAEDATLDAIVDLMEQRRVKQVPILRDGRLVGIVARADLLAALARSLEAHDGARAGDAEIRRAMLATLEAQGCPPRAGVEVMVRDGQVRLEGMIYEASERAALRTAAEGTAGVVGVDDRLVLVDPATGMAADVP